jgi:integrating conjugative element relaxase (TIGR03760 family)
MCIMEAILFRRLRKKGANQRVKMLKDLTRVVNFEQMLSDDKRTTLLEQIRSACFLEDERFDSLCLTIIHHLIYHCQQLPDSSNSYYTQPSGLLDYALDRTNIALTLFKQYVIKDEKTNFSEEQKLWQYALLSAALLQGIGKLYVDYHVELYDSSGQFLKPWNPLLENFSLIGSYYNYTFKKETNSELRRLLNSLLARFLMPASGFNWIASDPQVLATWLALLNENPYFAGTLGIILIRANALAISHYFNQQHKKAHGLRASRYALMNTFTGGALESVNHIEQQIGIEFIQWLNKSLASCSLMINKGPLLMVPGGMLMSPEIFALFVRENPEFKNWQAVQNGFLSLKLHRLAPDGSTNSRFEQPHTQQLHNGILFSEYAVALPAKENIQLHNLDTGKVVAISATEIIHLAQYNTHFNQQNHNIASKSLNKLNTAGQWQDANPAQAIAPLLKHGIMTNV